MTESSDCALRDLHDDGIFSLSLHGLYSVEAPCITWLIQETALSNSFMSVPWFGTSGRICRIRVSQCGAHVIH